VPDRPLGSPGDCRVSEALAQACDGANDGSGMLVFAKLMHEGTVDLDLVKGERVQIAQRGVAGTEIIHGNPNPHIPQLVKSRHGCVVLEEKNGLRDLQFKAARIEA